MTIDIKNTLYLPYRYQDDTDQYNVDNKGYKKFNSPRF